jgi:hypothetical protein
MSSILLFYRNFKNLDQIEVSNELSIGLIKYMNLEAGLTNVDGEVAMKLSKLYKAPQQIFLLNNSVNNISITYSDCSFHGSNGYVNHLYADDSVKNELVDSLKIEIKRLHEENSQLIKLLLIKYCTS